MGEREGPGWRGLMFKIPKQEYAAEFDELTVKRVKAGWARGRVGGAGTGAGQT